MPGILPMKMIRVGGNSQSRIAQACDRCRSKKIRCDGVRPCCTQCSNVGFECKTSDKLSRRAFPRGYTESLEDRVRALEQEVRELKDLLDEKDEKIDMLSRIHNFSTQSRKSSLSPNNTMSALVETEDESQQEDVILVEIPAAVQPSTSSRGTSATSALIEAFEEKVQRSGRSCPPVSPSSLLKPSFIASKALAAASPNIAASPPRLLSDQFINLYFQEWQPLLPVLHRPTFLKIYEQYLADPEARSWQNNKHAIAQLFLIFEVAAHSASSRTKPATASYELQWRKALSAISSQPTIATIQCHVLAQLCYLLKADYPHLLRHRAYAVSMIHQLGLHQGHKSHSLPVFEAETRKKVFWCQYVLDKFASAATGTPQALRDADITAEYPIDVDDENINVHGISPALPGELTKFSSALALFRCSRILGRALETLYPAKATYQLSLRKLHSLSDELDQWQEELPDHLRLRFCNDKPATNLVGCRSPLLSLAYFSVRSLIHRPLLCYGTGSAASAATIVLAAAAKHELQILDLLDERAINYTFPFSKQDLLLNIGFSVLWQTIGLEKDSKLVKDNQKSLTLLIHKLTKESQTATAEFQQIASSFIAVPNLRTASTTTVTEHPRTQSLPLTTTSTSEKQKSTRKQIQAMASRLSSFNGKVKNEDGLKRASVSQSAYAQSLSPNPRANSTVSLSSTRSAPVAQTLYTNTLVPGHEFDSESAINLDYFPIHGETLNMVSNNSSTTMLPPKNAHTVTAQPSWDQLVDSLDIASPDMFSTVSPTALHGSVLATCEQNLHPSDWSNELWQMSGYDMASSRVNVPQSLLSFSEESLTSADDLVFSASGSHNGSTGTNETFDMPRKQSSSSASSHNVYKGIAMPVTTEYDFEDEHS